jgi:hypothetical protein
VAAIERTAAIAGRPSGIRCRLEAARVWLLVLAGQVPPAVELDAMMARFVAADDKEAKASLLATLACIAFAV